MLKVEHLSYEIEEDGKKQEILKDVSFEVADGEMLVVTGPNGGGKSTIAKLMMGLYHATEGKIFLDGEDITKCTIYDRAKAGIGFAFQQPPRFKGMTIRRLLSLAAGTELPKHICCGLLSRVGLCAEEYLDREVDATLSGGEMKRIEIATVLVKKHKLCIFDEPEAGIDLWSFAMLEKGRPAFDFSSGAYYPYGGSCHDYRRRAGDKMRTDRGDSAISDRRGNQLSTVSESSGRCVIRRKKVREMILDKITEKVLHMIDGEGFKQEGAFNLRENGIAVCHGE